MPSRLNPKRRPQLETWIEGADRQLADLERQREELGQTIEDLRALRDEAAKILDTNSTGA